MLTAGLEEKTTMLDINNLCIHYRSGRNSVTALDGISFQLKPGDRLGIIGESGCGKSTLALSIPGLIRNARITGDILFNGNSLNGLSEKKIAPYRWYKIGIVFQNSLEVLNPVLTIGEQIGEAIQRHVSLSRSDTVRRIESLMTSVGLDPELRHEIPHRLSGGMRQRVLVAMGISCDPELLIVDEPTSALDPGSSNEILSLIETLQKKKGFSLIMISHNLSAIQRMTSRVMTLYCGRCVEFGYTADVLKNPMHTYTRGLVNSSPEYFKYKDLSGIYGDIPTYTDTRGCSFETRCCQRDEICRKSRPNLRYVSLERKVACHKGGIETLMTVRNITKTFGYRTKPVHALNDISLDLNHGEFVALVGRSGSGKTTLAHIMVNLTTADSGEIRYLKRLMSETDVTRKPGGIQIVFQDPFSSTSHRMSVVDTVMEPLVINRLGKSEEKTLKAVNALSMAGLPVAPEFLSRYVYTLSGGQRQRLSIARALVMEPKLLIADEITSMLDPSTQANLLRKLKELQTINGFTMLYITHDLHLARKIADRVCVMSDGRIVETGPSFEILDNPHHPETLALVNSCFDHGLLKN